MTGGSHVLLHACAGGVAMYPQPVGISYQWAQAPHAQPVMPGASYQPPYYSHDRPAEGLCYVGRVARTVPFLVQKLLAVSVLLHALQRAIGCTHNALLSL